MKLYTKIFIGLLAGLAFGVTANLIRASTGNAFLAEAAVAIEPLGIAWIRAITMIVIPLVVASLMVGVAGLGDLRTLGRFGGKTIAYYIGTTAIAVTIGLVLSNIVQPGSGLGEASQAALRESYAGDAASRITMAGQKPGLVNVLLDLIPPNPVRAAADGDMLPLIVFTLLFGAAASLLKEDLKANFLGFFRAVNAISMTIIMWIMKLAPYAVFILLASVTAQFGFDILQSLLLYVLTVVAGLLIHAFGTYAISVRLLARLSHH